MLDREKVRLGIAPIGWTNDDMPELGAENTFEQCVSEMALAGFSGCEIGNKFPADVAVLKHKLDVRGLSVCNAWFSSFLTRGEGLGDEGKTLAAFEAHCRRLRALGAKVVGVSEQGNSIQGSTKPILSSEKPRYTEAQWKAVTEGFDKMGRIARGNGLSFACHHHMGTGVQTPDEIDRLMSQTDGELVFLLFDSGHLSFAGIDPEPVLKKYAKRIRHVHLKDMRRSVHARVSPENMSFLDAVRAGVFTVPGDGDVNFEPLFDILAGCGYEGWLVVEAEQDPAAANPFEYAKIARKYIAEKTGL